MAVFVGVDPGGKKAFAAVALYWEGRWPALLANARLYSSVREITADIVGICGEWGALSAVGIDAPLTWADTVGGWRPIDLRLRDESPEWWRSHVTRSPHAQMGSTLVQGPALAWRLLAEVMEGILPAHPVFETHSDYSLTHLLPHAARQLETARKGTVAEVRRTVTGVVGELVQSGVLRLADDHELTTSHELFALLAAFAGMWGVEPTNGWVGRLKEGGEITPVGAVPVALLRALP